MTDLSRMPAIYLPHGGGPCFFMDWEPRGMWDPMGAYLSGIAETLPQRPKALLIVSAHWEGPEFTVQTKAAPGLLFDYYGFPEQTYQLRWPAPGAPDLARRVQELAAEAGIGVTADHERDFDHGVFVPMLLAFPDADIPTIQVSLKAGLDAAAHLALGRALAPLRDEGVLIIGSGMSFHNLRRLMQRESGGDIRQISGEFDTWLQQAVTGDRSILADWQNAPHARICHPREEHLLPLMVVAGAAGSDPATMPYHEDSLGPTGIALSAFHFG